MSKCAISGLRSQVCGSLGRDGCAYVLSTTSGLQCKADRENSWLRVHGEEFYIEGTACTGLVSVDKTECVSSCSPGVVSPTDTKSCVSRCPDGYEKHSDSCTLCPLFWSRRTETCVTECRYLQRNDRSICEDPEDAIFCASTEL